MASSGEKTIETNTTLTTSVALGSQEDFQVYCQPCDEDGTRLPAHGYCIDCKQHLCQVCFSVHRKHKLSKDHTLLDATSMPNTLHKSATTCRSDVLNRHCLKHSTETIWFYCHDHKELLCNVCVTLKHKAKLQVTSCKVSYIPDISDAMMDCEYYQDVLNSMNTIFNQCIRIEADARKIVADSNRTLQTALADIKQFRKEINQRLDEMEGEAQDGIKSLQKKSSKYMQTIETTCGDITKYLKTSSDIIRQHNTFKQSNKLFVELKLAEKAVKEYEKTTQQLTTHDVKDYIFKPNEKISKILTTEKSLGTLKQEHRRISCAKLFVERKTRQVSHKGQICVQTCYDKEMCFISGIVLLHPNLLVITDWENKAVKLIDTRIQSVTVSHQLTLRGKPWDIAKITNAEVAVTLPCHETIQLIKFTSSELRKKRSIKTNGECHGISCHQDMLVVSINNHKIQILDLIGNVLTTVNGNTMSNGLFCVKANGSFIYASDDQMNKVLRFNWQGKLKGSYYVSGECCGLELSDDDTVFVCNADRNTLEEISGDFSSCNVILKDLERPWNVCWCAETRKLYYSCYTKEGKNDNFLQVFRMS